MRNSQRLMVGLVAALVALAAGVYVGKIARSKQLSGSAFTLSAEALARLFATRLADPQGRQQSLAQWQGNTLIVNFWATWCPPCREEMPAFSRLQLKYAANGVQFVGISIDSADNVSKFSRQFEIPYPLLIGDAAGAALMPVLGNPQQALPYTLVLGPANDVLLRRLGQVSERELDALLQKTTHQ